MKHTIGTIVASLSALTAMSVPATAGGIEHYCLANGVEIVESWPAPTGIPLTVCTGPAANFILPGFPPTTCSQALDPDTLKYPGFQSIARAADAWATASGPVGTPGTFSISPIYNFRPWGGTQWYPQLTLLTNPVTMPRENMVTYWEPAASFTNYGGDFAIGVTVVDLNVATGAILEADIAIQVASTDSTGNFPLWCGIEQNTLWGATMASTVGPAASFADPVYGYVDLQGVLTHEFGHFAGLGHSVLDSTCSPTSSQFPTMFQFAQTFTFNQSVNFYFGSGCSLGLKPANGALTIAGGILARSASTLEADDVAAIAAAYPSLSFPHNFGTIQGTITSATGPVRGASVVAISTTDPTNNRVGTISYDTGAYSIQGLVPGHYYVYVEPIDQDPLAAGSAEYYFPTLLVPNYVYLPYPGGSPFSACTPYQYFATDFFDPSEAGTAGDTSFTNISGMGVSAGGLVTANFNVETTNNMLTVDDLSTNPGAPIPSARGVFVPFNAPTFPMVEFHLRGLPNKRAAVYFDTLVTPTIVNGQLRQVADATGAGAPAKITGFTDANGDFVVQLQIKVTQGLRNVFAQGQVDTGGSTKISNVVNVWVTRP